MSLQIYFADFFASAVQFILATIGYAGPLVAGEKVDAQISGAGHGLAGRPVFR